MKKFILAAALFAAAFIPTQAQWAEKFDTCVVASPAGVENYGYEVKTTQDGLSYVYMQLYKEEGVHMCLQIINADGTKALSGDGVELCVDTLMSSTLYGQCLMTDRDGNAIVAVNDTRLDNGERDWDYEYSYTIYKVSPAGDVLWSKTLNKGVSLGVETSMKMTCTDDGSYVFAYASMINWGISKIYVEKLTNDGKDAWESPIILADENEVNDYSYPYIVDAGNSETILVYAVGPYAGEQHLMARLIAADGSSAWGDDVAVYDGGGMAEAYKPIYTMMNVAEGPEGGALISWMETDATTGLYQNKLSYIKNDGTYGFSTGSDGTVVSNYDNYCKQYPEVCYSPEADAFYCLFYMYEPNGQVIQSIYLQKMSKEGELLFGANGLPVVDFQEEDMLGYYSIKPLSNGNVAAFYMRKNYLDYNAPAYSYAIVYDSEGNTVGSPLSFSTQEIDKSDLQVSDLLDGNYFVANWEDSNYNICLTKVALSDITTGISYAKAEKSVCHEKRSFYSLDGQRKQSLQRGFNIVRSSDANGVVRSRKVIY